MTRFNLCRNWLLLATTSMILLGLLMVFFNQHPVVRSINAGIHEVFWPRDQIPRDALLFQRWVYGGWGATIAGMGVMATILVYRGFRDRLRWARDSLAAGIFVWYVFDTLVSLLSGVVSNAVANTVILVSFAIPLSITWRDF